jgi:HK97 family phage major capsid protein
MKNLSLENQEKLIEKLKNAIAENKNYISQQKKDLRDHMSSINNSTDKKICEASKKFQAKLEVYLNEINDLKKKLEKNEKQSEVFFDKDQTKYGGKNYNLAQREPNDENDEDILKNAFPEKSQYIRKDNRMANPTLKKKRILSKRKTKRGGYVYRATRKNKIVSSTRSPLFARRRNLSNPSTRRTSKFGGK